MKQVDKYRRTCARRSRRMRHRSRPAIESSAEAFALPSAIEAYRQAAAEIARIAQPVKVEALALAKVGFQYISKIGFSERRGDASRAVPMAQRGGRRWAIVSVEDTTGKRSSWSDIPDLAAAVAEARAGNGNA